MKLKRERLVLFGVVLLFLMVGTVFAGVVWYDDFNDNSLGGMWTILMHGLAGVVEQNQRIEIRPYGHLLGENWMSGALQLVNNGWIPFTTGTRVTIEIPNYWNVQSVDLVLTNSIYNPMSAHRRYTISWVNNWVDGTGDVWVYEQIGSTVMPLFHKTQSERPGKFDRWGVPYYPYSAMMFAMVRENEMFSGVMYDSVSFWLGENDNNQGTWVWTRLTSLAYMRESYGLGTNYPDYIFDAYNSHPNHETGTAYFDNFYVVT